MKELLRANNRQINHLAALNKVLITARGAQQVLESKPDSIATIKTEDSEVIICTAEFVSILHRAAQGYYTELVYPLIEKDRGKVKYFRATNKKMRKAAQKIIDEAQNARFEPKKYKF